MQITKVRIKIINENKVRAIASITLDDSFIVKKIKIIEGKKGYFIAMPQNRTNHENAYDIAFPKNNKTRIMIENKVLDAYERELNK